MPEASKAQPSPNKFKVDRQGSGDVTLLTMHGVVDEGFGGRKLAEGIRTNKVIVSLREVRRYASWGMSEWMDFLRGLAGKDLYLVECSTYAVGQINLVTGLIGHGKLVSFYTPYQCTSCHVEFESLFLVPIDRATILDLESTPQVCSRCGGQAKLDNYPAAIATMIAERPAFDIDDEVVAFLRAQFKYGLTPDATRFRAHRRAEQAGTYLRLSGNLGRLPPEVLAAAPERKTVLDLAAATLAPDDFQPWRNFISLASEREAVTSLQLLDCPPGFLEIAVQPEDFRGKLKIRSFGVPYPCAKCERSTLAFIDVAEHLEHLVAGVIPATKCTGCGAVLQPAPSRELTTIIRYLPARERDHELDKLVTKARAEPITKLEDCLVGPRTAKKAAPKSSRMIYLAFALGLLILAGLVVVALGVFTREPTKTTEPVVAPPTTADAPPAKPAVERPDWVLSDVPASAFCHDILNRLMCIGVSSYQPTRNEAALEAKDAALEELVNTIGLKISNPAFQQQVLPAYSDIRAKALAALQAAETDRTSIAYEQANTALRKARKRVVEVLEASGGPAVPAQRSDWYWEEYAKESGGGTEVLVFVRYDIGLDALKALVDKYSASVPAMKSTAMTAFPALAWRNPEFSGGAMLTKVGRPFADNVKPKEIVMAVDEQRVMDAASLATKLAETTKAAFKVTVLGLESPTPRTVEVKR